MDWLLTTWAVFFNRFGLSFLGRDFDEVKLIGLAYAFEQKTRVRGTVKPYLVPKAEVVVS